MRKAKSCTRLLSLVLCICMVLSLAPVQVLALDACDRGDGCRSCSVQKLVDALPDEVTAESAEAVAAQLATIDSEKASLTDEELARVDFAKYTAAISAINDPASQTGTQKAVAEDTSDFHISDGVLIRYLGSAESVEIPDGVTEIGEMAFMNNYFITSVTIPKSVTTIGRGAFRNAKYLRTVNIPASVTSIGEEAFYNTDIRALHLPDSLTSIGKKAFYRSYLVTVDFYRTDNRADLVIGEQAFQGSSNLYVLSLASVSHIGSYAFLDCGNLTTLEYWGTTIPTHGSQPFSEIQVSEVKVTDAYASTLFCNIPVSVLYYSIKTSAEPSRGGYAHLLNYESRFSVSDKTVYLSALPEAGYNFVGWKYEGEIVSTAANHSFTMPAKAVTYIAVFEKNHTCDNTTYTDAGNGTHSYECSVCGINAENHSFDTGSSCTVCGAACKHESYTDGTCTACGVACGHSLDTDGLCTVCGGYEPAVLSGSVYQIGNAGQLFWFAELVNEGSTRASAVLTADITIPAGMKWTPIGNASQPYRGTFNGGDHTISGLYFSDDSADYVGLFGIVESTGKIQNTGLVETSIMAKKSVGTVTGYSLGTVERCWAENITVSATANLGGVVGLNRGTVNNCWVSGVVTMRNTSNSAGGIVGYNYGSVSNCFSLARVTGTARQGALIGTINKHESLSTAGSVTNCYYDSSKTVVAVANTIDGTVTDVSSKTTEAFASGEAAYLLGEAWGQTIGTDNYPVLGGRKVYQVTNCKEETNYSNANEDLGHTWSNGKCTTCGAGCDHNGSTHNTVTDKGDGTHSFTCTVCGTVATGDHTGGEATCTTQAVCEVCGASYGDVDKTNHDETVTYVNGFCPYCDTYKPAALNADGYYEISNAGQLMWFAEFVNAGNFTAGAVLTDNIDMNGLMWTPIGTTTAYTGTFDGKGFAIQNLWQNSNGANGSRDGLVVTLGTGGVVMGITIDNAAIWGADLYSTNSAGAIANRNNGTICDCVVKNSSIQQGAYEYLGGIVGANGGTIENCAVIGCSFTRRWGGTDAGSMGAIAQTNNGTVKNCFSYGCSFNNGRADKAAIVAVNNGTLENCYYYTTGTVATTYGTAKTPEQFASGEVAYLLGEAFGQTISTDDHPILSGAKVYQVTNCKGETAYSNTEENGAHTEQTVTGKAPTCTETGLTDGVICSVCGETLTTQEEIPVLSHSYEDDVCTVCGHIGVPVKLDSASLSFKEKIHYNIFFSLGLDETVDLSDMGLVMFDSLKADGTMDDAIAIYAGAVEMDGKYMVATDGVPAKYMGDTIYFRAYAKLADGSYVYSKTVEYSAVTYAEHILNSDKPESAKALVVAMLNYGAAAQMYFGYNTDNLVNAFLTDEQKALPEQYRDDMANTVPMVAAEKQGIFANNKGFSKRTPAVSFEGAFEINYFFTPTYAPVDGITLYYWTEADFEANEVLTVDHATGSVKLEGTDTEQYCGDIGGIAAKNLSENIYVAAIYSDGITTHTSGVLGYSIGAYCGRLAAKGGAMADLAMATAVYGYHAKQYFGS